MYKTLAALVVVLVLVSTGLYKLELKNPTPVATSVLAGGEVAMILPDDLTLDQRKILSLAYDIAKEDGHKHPEMVQQILLQETHAGGLKKFKVAGNKGDEYFGLGQIKLGAARDVMAAYPELWNAYEFHTRTDDELKANLILNPVFNIRVTSKYLKLLHDRYGLSGRTLMNAYNRGPAGVKEVDSGTFHYALGAESKLASWKKVNWEAN